MAPANFIGSAIKAFILTSEKKPAPWPGKHWSYHVEINLTKIVSLTQKLPSQVPSRTLDTMKNMCTARNSSSFFLLYDPKGHFIVPQLSLSSAFSCSYFTVIRSPVFTFSIHISGVHAFGRRLCNFVGNSREGCVYGFVVERCAPGL